MVQTRAMNWQIEGSSSIIRMVSFRIQKCRPVLFPAMIAANVCGALCAAFAFGGR
jgi:hypothetical protein